MRRTGISLAAPFRHGQKARRRLKLCRRKAQKHLTCTPSDSNGKRQGCSLRPKQVVLVSRLVLIALQFGANWRPKQLVLVEWKFPPVCSGGPTTFREAENGSSPHPFSNPSGHSPTCQKAALVPLFAYTLFIIQLFYFQIIT